MLSIFLISWRYEGIYKVSHARLISDIYTERCRWKVRTRDAHLHTEEKVKTILL